LKQWKKSYHFGASRHLMFPLIFLRSICSTRILFWSPSFKEINYIAPRLSLNQHRKLVYHFAGEFIQYKKEENRIFGCIKSDETFALSLSIPPINFLPFVVSGIMLEVNGSMSFALTIFRFTWFCFRKILFLQNRLLCILIPEDYLFVVDLLLAFRDFQEVL
jgi:hypothetical protein